MRKLSRTTQTLASFGKRRKIVQNAESFLSAAVRKVQVQMIHPYSWKGGHGTQGNNSGLKSYPPYTGRAEEGSKLPNLINSSLPKVVGVAAVAEFGG